MIQKGTFFKPFLVGVLCSVTIFPQLDKQDQRMESEEDDDRKCDPLDNDPRLEAVVVLLKDGGKGLLQPEGVVHPHAQVQQDEESDRLKDPIIS